MYWVPSSLTLLTYAPASPIKLEATDLAWSGLILVWPCPPEPPELPPDPEPEPDPEPDPDPEPELLPPLEFVPPLLPLEPELPPLETSEPVPSPELSPNKSPIPLSPELVLSGENPVKSLNTALSPSLIPYAVTPAAIHKTIITDMIMFELSIISPPSIRRIFINLS